MKHFEVSDLEDCVVDLFSAGKLKETQFGEGLRVGGLIPDK